MPNQKGFTLLETTLYIALFGLLFGSVVLTVYNILASSQKLNEQAVVEQEGDFIVQKISWVLHGASSFSVVTSTQSGSTLSVATQSDPAHPIIINATSNQLGISEQGLPFVPLSSGNVVVSQVQFTDVPKIGARSEGVHISFNLRSANALRGENFNFIMYLPQ